MLLGGFRIRRKTLLEPFQDTLVRVKELGLSYRNIYILEGFEKPEPQKTLNHKP